MVCRFALAFTLYYPMMHVMAYYCHDYPTFRSFWFATINSNNMWYCFLKAWCNVVLSKFTKKESGFKVGTVPSYLSCLACQSYVSLLRVEVVQLRAATLQLNSTVSDHMHDAQTSP